MGYFILQQDLRIVGQPALLGCPDSVDPEEFLDGRVLPTPGTPLRFSLSPRSTKYRGCIISGIVTLFHDVFRMELTRLGIDNIQYFPVELQNPEGEIELKYSLVNVIGLIEAVDASNSVITPRAGGGRGVLESFKIKESAARGQRLFRLAENPTLIIIDQTLRDSLEAFNPPGVLMLPTDRYEGY